MYRDMAVREGHNWSLLTNVKAKMMGSSNVRRQLTVVLEKRNERRKLQMFPNYCLHTKGNASNPQPMTGKRYAQATEVAGIVGQA